MVEVSLNAVLRLIASRSVAAPSVSVSSAEIPSAAAEVSSAAASEWSSLLFVHLGGHVVLCVHFACEGLFCNFEGAISSDVESHVASEQVYVAVLDVYGVSVVDFFDVVIPECQVYAACFVSD